MINNKTRAQIVGFFGNKILIMKRSEFNPVQSGKWDFGEYIITGETPFTIQLHDSVKRNLDIGCEILYDCNENAIPVATYTMQHERPDPYRDGPSHSGIVFGADLFSDKIKIRNKLYSEYKFVTLNMILAMSKDDVAFATFHDVAVSAMSILQISTVSYF